MSVTSPSHQQSRKFLNRISLLHAAIRAWNVLIIASLVLFAKTKPLRSLTQKLWRYHPALSPATLAGQLRGPLSPKKINVLLNERAKFVQPQSGRKLRFVDASAEHQQKLVIPNIRKRFYANCDEFTRESGVSFRELLANIPGAFREIVCSLLLLGRRLRLTSVRRRIWSSSRFWLWHWLR
jgi:hypothetical protein